MDDFEKVLRKNQHFQDAVKAIKTAHGGTSDDQVNLLIHIMQTLYFAFNGALPGLPLRLFKFDEIAWRNDQKHVVGLLEKAADTLRDMRGYPRAQIGKGSAKYIQQFNEIADAWVITWNLANKIKTMNPVPPSLASVDIQHALAKRGVSKENATAQDRGAAVRSLGKYIPKETANRYALIAGLLKFTGIKITSKEVRSSLEPRRKPVAPDPPLERLARGWKAKKD